MEDVERAIRELSLLTRAQVMEEAAHDQGFWSYFAPLALSPNPSRAVDEDMTKALINEMDPTRFPETVGRWPMLRALLRQAIAMTQAETAVGTAFGMGCLHGLGQEEVQGGVWEAISSVIGSVGKTATQLYQAYLNRQLERARIEAEKVARQRELEVMRRQAEAQRAAITQVTVRPAAPGGTQPPAAVRFPTWILYVLGALVFAVGGYAFYRKVRG